MRRSIQGAVALLSVLVIAGCSAPSPATTSAAPAAPTSSPPTPTPPPEVVEWTMPEACADAAWPALLRSGEVIEPLENWTWMGELPQALDRGLGCAAYVPNSDAGRSWGVARIPVAEREAALGAVAGEGFEIRTDAMVDGVRVLVLELFDETGGSMGGYRSEQILIAGDAWLWASGNEWFAREPLRWLASGLELPIDVDWLLPIDCTEQSDAWPVLAEDGRIGDTALRASDSSSVRRAFGQLEQDTLVSITECGWAAEPGDGYQFEAEQFSSSGRVPVELGPTFVDALIAEGWEVVDDTPERTDLVLRGDRPGAAIFTEGGFVSAEPLDAADPALLEPFARGIGMLD
jgi:hypothetical protein